MSYNYTNKYFYSLHIQVPISDDNLETSCQEATNVLTSCFSEEKTAWLCRLEIGFKIMSEIIALNIRQKL